MVKNPRINKKKHNISINIIRTNKMWEKKKIKTILLKEVNFRLGPEEIYPGEEEGKNIPSRAHMKAQK